MAATHPTPKHIFRERAAAGNLNDAEILNSNNPDGADIPTDSDVVVAGAGIHGLIYSVHAAKFKPGNLKISVIEKNTKPGYKIGESTLPLFTLWCKMLGLTGEYLLRLFGLKDGLEFYFFDRENQGEYGDFCSNGTPGLFASGFQVERPISELLFTLLAQRSGVNVYHGRQVDFAASKIQSGSQGSNKVEVIPGKHDGKPATTINNTLMVDATGRFRQFASKNAPLHRFEGWNYDAFWGYFDAPKDESTIPLRFYEGAHTNHLCFPEGWAWVIRLPSWEGSPIPNLMDMITYILDCAEQGVPGDEIPSSEELAKMFGCKFQWTTSIGFAVRNDVKYPEDMSAYGTREAERKFNYWVSKYDLIKKFMSNFNLIENLYGPGTTWFIRKSLTYQSPVVSGPGWLAIGDAVGFTNPLHSPGITAAMSTSVYAAELSHQVVEAKRVSSPDVAELAARKILRPYVDHATRMVPSLNKMNKFNYVCFRDPRLGVQVSSPWQYLAGVGIPYWQLIRQDYNLNFETYVPHSINWVWGCQVPEYEAVIDKGLELLTDIPIEEKIPEEKVQELIAYSNKVIREAVDSNKFNFRWDGLLRYYDLYMNYDEKKITKDTFARQCKGCGSWFHCRPDWRKCYSCGLERSIEEATITWNPPLSVVDVKHLVRAADAKNMTRAQREEEAAKAEKMKSEPMSMEPMKNGTTVTTATVEVAA